MPGISQVYRQIGEFARQRGVHRVILYGSRARGTNGPKSDIDIAAEGSRNFRGFEEDVQDHLNSLLVVDLVNLDTCLSEELRNEIARDGRVIYEEV